jgi:hypothetical protein
LSDKINGARLHHILIRRKERYLWVGNVIIVANLAAANIQTEDLVTILVDAILFGQIAQSSSRFVST